MITVRLPDGTRVFGFSASAIVAQRHSGERDPFWLKMATDSVVAHGDLKAGLLDLPGAELLWDRELAGGGAYEPPVAPRTPLIRDRLETRR